MRATDELLTERSRRVFNAANAILVLDGPPPDGLSVPLPAGEYLPAAKAEPVSRPLPAAYRDEIGLTLSGVVTRTHEAGFLPVVLERALHDGLRRHSGSAFGLWSSMADVDNEHAVVAGGSEVVDEMLPTLAKAALEVTGQLAEQGVPREWVQEAVERRLRVLESPAAEVETALEAAYAALSDQVPMTYDELLSQLRSTDPTEGRPGGPGAARLAAGRPPRGGSPAPGDPGDLVPRVAAPGHRDQAQPRQLARRHDDLLDRPAGGRAGHAAA